MNDRIPPAASVEPDRRAGDRRSSDRRSGDRRQPAGGKNLPVPVDAAAAARPSRPAGDAGSTEFNAQLIGQVGQKRGLKGGPPVLTAARAVYLSTEWSGPQDRRVRAGRITRTDI
jgi:hypothetical protein